MPWLPAWSGRAGAAPRRAARSRRVRQARLQRAGAGEQQAAVDVQHRHRAGRQVRRGLLEEPSVVASRQPHDARSSASWLSWSSSESATPMPTAAGDRQKSVATNVVDEGDPRREPARRDGVDRAPMRSEPRAAKISTAASVGMATWPTIPENTHQDQQHPDARADRGPAGARARREVQCGLPDRAAHRLPAEEARGDVADALGGEVAVRVGRRAVGLGAASATPAPCTSTIAATASAPTTRSLESSREVGQVRRAGRRSGSRRRRSTRVDVVRAEAGERGHDQRDQRPTNADRRVRASAPASPRSRRPTAADAGSIAPGWVTTFQAFATATRPSLGRPSRSGSCPQDDVHGDAAQEPDHHRVRDEARVAARAAAGPARPPSAPRRAA